MKTQLQPKPTRDYILIEREKLEEKTSSGIYIPTQAEHKVEIGKALGCGPTVEKVQEGDRLLFKDFAVLEVEIGLEKFCFVREEDIIATL